MPIEVVAVLLLALWGATALIELAVGPYWEKKFMTEARRKEIEARKEQRKREKRARNFTEAAQGALVKYYAYVILFGLPAIFIVDGAVFRIGLLYSPYLSFFNPLDGDVQLAGTALSAIGLVISVPVTRTLAEQVFGKAEEERKLITTGIYAYVRHPSYLSLILTSTGMLLVTLNYLTLLLLPPALLGFPPPGIEGEEQELLRRFGKEYEAYMKRTGKLLPRIRR